MEIVRFQELKMDFDMNLIPLLEIVITPEILNHVLAGDFFHLRDSFCHRNEELGNIFLL